MLPLTDHLAIAKNERITRNTNTAREATLTTAQREAEYTLNRLNRKVRTLDRPMTPMEAKDMKRRLATAKAVLHAANTEAAR